MTGLGAHLKRLRVRKGISQGVMAMHMRISQSQLSRLEHEQCEMSLGQFADYTSKLGRTMQSVIDEFEAKRAESYAEGGA